MQLEDGQQVIAMLVAGSEEQTVLTATENGYGKRTPITEYTRHGRGTKGMIAIQTSERNGKVVAATLVDAEDQIMLITTAGVLIRTRVSEIREMGAPRKVLHSSVSMRVPSSLACSRSRRPKRERAKPTRRRTAKPEERMTQPRARPASNHSYFKRE